MTGTRINYSGLVIAGIGFFLTRFTVTLAIYQDPVRFYLAGIVPLVLGLGLAAFGVALAVADVEASLVRTTMVWCVIGLLTMLLLAVLTLVGSRPGEFSDMTALRSRAYLSNFLIGGSIGGTLTGLYAGRTQKQRVELGRQADRLDVLNRFLRHEILNALTAIRGYAAIRREGARDAEAVINEHSDAIERTIEEVKYLTRTARTSGPPIGSIDIHACLVNSVETVRREYPNVDVIVARQDDETFVRATDQLERVFTHLLENAAVHASGEDATVEVSVTETTDTVRVSVSDDGPGLPESQRQLLESGNVKSFDDPGTGFGLNIVRFLVESFEGSIETTVGEDGSTITVVLPRPGTDETGLRPSSAHLAGFRPSLPHLLVTFGAAVFAGILYGFVAVLLGGSVSGIGVFYGAPSPVVGWITHEFHSIVFGFVFAGLISLVPEQYHDHVPAYLMIGVGWGLVLWLLAAGFVAPIWLRLLGFPESVPNLSARLLGTHLIWGISLGPLTALGYRHITPWLERRGL
ncbi:MAG: HAMP domain-containing sensor histidine kinase [Halapricum sp.]